MNGTKIAAGILLVAAVILGLFALGGDKTATQKTSPLFSEPGEPRLIVVLLDMTGSYPYFAEAKSKLRQLIETSRRGDEIYVVTIGPWATENVDMRVKPDPQLLSKIRNFPKERAYCAALGPYKENLLEQVEKLEYENLQETDIYGALYYATLILQKDSSIEKFLVIFSDLGDTVGRTDKADEINLSGVKVRCLYFPTELSVAEGKRYKLDPEGWRERFLAWGADSVEIYNHVTSSSLYSLR